MTVRLALVAIAAAVSLVACDSTSPTVAPRVNASSPSAAAPASTIASAEPSAAIEVDDPSYLAGEPFVVPVNDDGLDWIAPASPPVMPNGEPAVRVAFVPASCAAEDFRIGAGVRWSKDPWEISLDEAATEHASMGSPPDVEVPECLEGRGRTYLEVGYHPLSLGIIHLGVTLPSVTDAPTKVELVPVYTSADATQPTLAMPSIV